MSNRLTELLDAHDGLREKSRDAQCPFDVLADSPGVDSAEILDATLYVEGSHFTSEGDMFIYRGCGKTACAAECGMVIDIDRFVLDGGRFQAPCTGKL